MSDITEAGEELLENFCKLFRQKLVEADSANLQAMTYFRMDLPRALLVLCAAEFEPVKKGKVDRHLIKQVKYVLF